MFLKNTKTVVRSAQHTTGLIFSNDKVPVVPKIFCCSLPFSSQLHVNGHKQEVKVYAIRPLQSC